MKIVYVIISILSLLIIACKENKAPKASMPEKPAEISSEHRCANCGMYTGKQPNWEEKIISDDKGILYFDGPRCMFKILLDPETTPKSIDEIQVKDYYSLQYIDGKRAFYVIGSDVLGPMGNELVPFRTLTAAEDFSKDHKGKKILTFDEVTMDLIIKLAGKMEMK